MEFLNQKYNVTFQNVSHIKDDDVVVKNAAFLINITPKGDKESFSKLQQNKSNVQAKLVYENNIQEDIHLLNSASVPMDYNVYFSKDLKTLTIEARIYILSSKHENSLFKVIVQMGNVQVLSGPIKCVSKLVENKKSREDPMDTTDTITSVVTNSYQPTTPTITNTATQKIKKTKDTSCGSTKVIRCIKQLQENKKKDRKLIQLLYKQNKAMVEHINSMATTINELVSAYNHANQCIASSSNTATAPSSVDSNNIVMAESQYGYAPEYNTSPPLSPTYISSQDEQIYPQVNSQNSAALNQNNIYSESSSIVMEEEYEYSSPTSYSETENNNNNDQNTNNSNLYDYQYQQNQSFPNIDLNFNFLTNSVESKLTDYLLTC